MTHYEDILVNFNPDSSGDAFEEPYSTKATNDQYNHPVLILNDSGAEEEIAGIFRVPANYVGTAELAIEWSSTATSGSWEADFHYSATGGSDSETMDPSADDESVNDAATAPTTAHNKMTKTISLTDGNFAADDMVQFRFTRDGTDAGDTMAAAVIIYGLYFKYDDV